MTIKHLLAFFPVTDQQLADIRRLLPDAIITQRTKETLTQADVDAADVTFGNIPFRMLVQSPNLKWAHLASAGTDSYLPLIEKGILLTNGTGAYNDSIAEFMLTLTGALCNRLPAYAKNMRSGTWQPAGWNRTIMGSTVVVLGCGNIGTAYAKRMHALGAYVIGVRRTASHCPEGVDEMVTMDEADTVLPRADIVAMVLPNTPETVNFMDARRLSLLKDGTLLVNCGRGNALNPDALYDALVSGKLDGAAMDVSYMEPLPPEDKLWDAPNILITPHIAGGWDFGGDCSPHMSKTVNGVFLKNLKAYVNDAPLPNTVDPKTGYTVKHR